ncbi:MAG: hypothetical protein J2P22_15145 [Nocardioides sp.]|nr:hypothetical protein [Nocardioides sp.]
MTRTRGERPRRLRPRPSARASGQALPHDLSVGLSPDPATSSAPWLVLCPPDCLVLRDPAPRQLRRVARGEPVVLVTDRVFGRRQLRRTARRSGLTVERELLVLPGTRHALVTVDEDPVAHRQLWERVAAVPPGLTWAWLPAHAALAVVRRVPWSWTGSAVGGHVLIGTRT